jgi:beta-phosphoglucomutase-like phosphatase (HAD superfamily)
MMSSSEEVSSTQAAPVDVKVSLLFELENVAVKGRAILFDVIKGVLSDKDVKLDPIMYSRYGLHASPEKSIPAILAGAGKKTSSEGKLISEVTQAQKLSLLDGSVKVDSGFKSVVDALKSQNVVFGALTALDNDAANQLVAKLGLGDVAITTLSCSLEGRDFPTADAWLKLAKQVGTKPQLCIVIASSSTACKAALSAGMRCIVIPDKFTTFQDFGGADFVIDEAEPSVFETVLELVRS